MKRDMDLIREIMLAFENSSESRLRQNSIVIENYSPSVVNFHIELLKDAGFINHLVIQPEARDGTLALSRIDKGMRLTNNGYEFLESIRDRDIWAKVKDGAGNVGNASLEMIWGLAKAYGRQVIADKLGINL